MRKHWYLIPLLAGTLAVGSAPAGFAAETKLREFQQDNVTSAYITNDTIVDADINSQHVAWLKDGGE